MNRDLARWCRQCGQGIAWRPIVDAWQRRLSLERGQDYPTLSQCDLTRAGVRELYALCLYQGYLLLATQGAGLLVTNAYCPHTDAFLERLLPSEEVLVLTPVQTQPVPQVLVRTSQTLYALYFLPHLHVKPVYTTTHGFLTPALSLPEGFLVCEPRAAGVVIQVIQPDTGQVVSSDVLPLGGEVLQWLALPLGRVLVWTESAALVYDVRSGQMAWQGHAPAEGFDMAVTPCYDPAQQQVYLGGRQRLWRLSLAGERGQAFSRVGDAVWQGYQFSISADGQEVYVTHGGGVSVIDSLTGRQRWSSETDLGMRAVAGLFAPVRAGEVLLFGRLNRRGTQDLCFMPLPYLDDIVDMGSYTQILHPPLLGPGSLLVSVRQEANILLQARRI